MNALSFQSLMLIFVGWANRRQQDMMGHLSEQDRVLAE
ncbi:MAG: hypothetical protein ACI8W3_000477 [Myxococcota bacterium]|jgi:hypothetical protein